jgi:hypothetical protein
MSAGTARLVWGILAAFGGVFSLIGFIFSMYGFRVALRRRILNKGTEKFVANRDILMLGSFVVASFIMVMVALGLVWLSFTYPQDLDPVLQALAIPVFLCYLGFAVATSLFSMAGPLWVVFRYWALVDALSLRMR